LKERWELLVHVGETLIVFKKEEMEKYKDKIMILEREMYRTGSEVPE